MFASEGDGLPNIRGTGATNNQTWATIHVAVPDSTCGSVVGMCRSNQLAFELSAQCRYGGVADETMSTVARCQIHHQPVQAASSREAFKANTTPTKGSAVRTRPL